MTGGRETSHTWLLPILLSLAPVVLGAMVIEAIGPGYFPDVAAFVLPDRSTEAGSMALLHHNQDRLFYGVAVVLHIGCCLFISVNSIRTVIRNSREFAWLIFLLVGVVAVLVGVAMAGLSVQGEWAVYTITYGRIETILDRPGSWLPTEDMPLLVLGPSLMGIVTVLFSAGAVASSIRLLNDGSHSERFIVEQIISNFKMLSFVLITSTIAALQFFRLALNPYTTSEAGRFDPGIYVTGLTTFWGSVFTLTLFVIYIGPLAELYFRARKQRREDDDHLGIREWLNLNKVEDTLTSRLKNIFTLLAPLLVGPFANAIDAIVSGLK